MSTALDYQGRTFDLLALRGGEATGDIELSQTLFDASVPGEVCTGIQKLAQAWVIEFFTETGSILFEPTRGCNFMISARRGVFRSENDVFAAFAISEIKVGQLLRASETDDTPEDEQYVGATLDSVGLADGNLSLGVTIRSGAGDSRQVILPIPILPTTLSL